MVSNTEQKTAVVGDDGQWQRIHKDMHVFVYLFLSTARPTRDCFADHVSAESHCAPSDELSVCPPAAFANERSARQTPPLSPPFLHCQL